MKVKVNSFCAKELVRGRFLKRKKEGERKREKEREIKKERLIERKERITFESERKKNKQTNKKSQQ